MIVKPLTPEKLTLILLRGSLSKRLRTASSTSTSRITFPRKLSTFTQAAVNVDKVAFIWKPSVRIAAIVLALASTAL